MDIRDAILKAADHIEANPLEFKFSSILTPDGPGCGTHGCALGWIGAFLKASGDYTDVARDWLKVPGVGRFGTGTPHFVFYDRMSAIQSRWMLSADACVSAMRAYADKYHPAGEPSLDPAFLAFLETLANPACSVLG